MKISLGHGKFPKLITLGPTFIPDYRVGIINKGPFKYYVSKIVGGWVWPIAYVCLHGGWVGEARFLHNQ